MYGYWLLDEILKQKMKEEEKEEDGEKEACEILTVISIV